MNIVVAPDKFKGSLTASQVCAAITSGLLRHDSRHVITQIPLADGGEGTLDILEEYLDLKTERVVVNDPLFRPVEASYKLSGTTAYIEMAQASGLDLLSAEERNCLHTTSLGTGELIYHAYQQGARAFFLFVGGSATCDAGLGVLQALDIQALQESQPLPPTGESLHRISQFKVFSRHLEPSQMRFIMVCDVRNPLYGPQGAAQVYGPQKGADATEVQLLDTGLRNLAHVVQTQTSREVSQFEGSGAAGGIAAGIAAFFPTEIQRGIDSIMNLVGLPAAIAAADLVITGEGRMDAQTLEGKVIAGVQGLCQQLNKDLGIICGSMDLSPQQIKKLGIWKVLPLLQPDVDLNQALDNAFNLVSERAYEMLSN